MRESERTSALPFALRYRMAYDAELTADVLRLFVRAIFASLRRRARARRVIPRAQCGAVTFVQRFGDALNLNVHFHTLALDGVYDPDDPEGIRFRPLPPPDDAEVARVAARVARGLVRLLARRDLTTGADPDDVDPLHHDQPLLAALYGASVRERIATGPRAGRRVRRLGDRIDAEDVATLEGPRLSPWPASASTPTSPCRHAIAAAWSDCAATPPDRRSPPSA